MSHKNLQAFTVVELLIVVFIIGILATLTVVGYRQVRSGASDTSILSDLDTMETAQTAYGLANGLAGKAYYSGTGTDTALKFTASAGNVIDVVINGSDFCIRGYNPSSASYSSLSSAATKESTPGACTTLSASAAAVAGDAPAVPPIVNLAANPSVETNATGFGGPNGSTVARSTTRARVGSASLVATMPIYAASSVGTSLSPSYAVPGTLPFNKTYTISAYVYVPTGTVDARLSIQGTGRQTVTWVTGYATSVKNGWTRISQAFTTITSGSGTVSLYVLNNAATTVAGTQFWVDSIMLTEGASPYTYADGTFTGSGWSWTGTANNSTSTGPPL